MHDSSETRLLTYGMYYDEVVKVMHDLNLIYGQSGLNRLYHRLAEYGVNIVDDTVIGDSIANVAAAFMASADGDISGAFIELNQVYKQLVLEGMR